MAIQIRLMTIFLYHHAPLYLTAQLEVFKSLSASFVENGIPLWYDNESPAVPKIYNKESELFSMRTVEK